MNHIAIIPARAGSKGIPNKNLMMVGKSSLVHRALSSAIGSGIFSQVYLSTDIPTLLEEKNVDWIIHSRPSKYCGDDVGMPFVVNNILDSYRVKDYTLVWLLQPTSPFRIQADYEKIKEILNIPDSKSVIAVTPVGDSHPSRHYLKSKFGLLKPILGDKANFENRQNLKPVFERNGLYYVTSAGDFRRSESFYVPRCRAYEVEPLRAFNINDPLDLKLAQVVDSWI